MNCIIAKIEPFSGTGDKYRNSRNSFARTRVDLIAAHSALLHDKLSESFFDENEDLKTEYNKFFKIKNDLPRYESVDYLIKNFKAK